MNKNDKLYPHHNAGFSRVGGGSSNVSGMAMKGMGHQGYVQKLAEEEIYQHKAGAKLDQGKVPLHFLKYFRRSLAAVSHHAAGGAKKYSPGGFLEVVNGQERYEDAMLRHYFTDEIVDEEHSVWVGQETLHATAVAWNALAALELILKDKEDEAT